MVKNEEKESENFQKEIPPGNEERNSKRVGGFAMSKTISVTKNPKNCSSCKFRIELGEGLNSCCELAGDVYNPSLYRMIKTEFGYYLQKPDWCPLTKLLEIQKDIEDFFNGDDKVWNELSKIYGKDRSNLSSGE